jgi:outer membrane lipoprotein carrier protein
VQDSLECNRSCSKCFLLKPKDEQADFSKAILGFKDNKLILFKLWDNLGQISVFNFSNIKLNTSISPNEFKFKIPPNVDVIKSE